MPAVRLFKDGASEPTGNDDVLRYQAFLELQRTRDRRPQFAVYAAARTTAESILRQHADVVLAVACVISRFLGHVGGVPLAALDNAIENPDAVSCEKDPETDSSHDSNA